MSMTKRYLDSLPQEEQNEILGEIDPDYGVYCDHPFQITGEECPNCGDPYPVNIRACVSGDLDDEHTRRLVEAGLLSL
jgi:hypothetical protein